jgi:hypothetical protein
MTDPVTMFLLSSGLSVAGAGASVMSQAGIAEAQGETNEMAKASAMEARNANYDQLHLMAQQNQDAAEQQIFENDTEALQATERAQVAAGESGVTGLSVDALLADMYGKQARYKDGVTQNLENQQQQVSFEAENTDRTYRSTVQNLSPIEKPNYLGSALKAGSGIFGAYKDHLKVK